MMKPTATLALLATMLLVSCRGDAQPKSRRTVLLELFTSQGCSSCPPADILLSKLQREDLGGTVIPLAYHVDYWNSLGWSDPFSSSKWSQRQNQYARAFKSSQVYTPQLVINGATQLVGSADGAIRTEIKRQLDGADRGTIVSRVTRAGTELRVDVRARLGVQPDTHARVFVVLFENGVTTSIGAGENAHRKLTNDAIVRWQEGVTDIEANGAEAKGVAVIPLDPAWRSDHLGIAAFIQDKRSMAIYASGTVAVF